MNFEDFLKDLVPANYYRNLSTEKQDNKQLQSSNAQSNDVLETQLVDNLAKSSLETGGQVSKKGKQTLGQKWRNRLIQQSSNVPSIPGDDQDRNLDANQHHLEDELDQDSAQTKIWRQNMMQRRHQGLKLTKQIDRFYAINEEHKLSFRSGLHISHPVTVQSKYPFESTEDYPNPIAYFEVKILKMENKNQRFFGIGLAPEEYPVQKVVGDDKSIGIRIHKGEICNNDQKLYEITTTQLDCNRPNQVVGVGYIFNTKTIFFTANGIEYFSVSLYKIKNMLGNTSGKLYPTISMGSSKDRVQINFGNDGKTPFVFNLFEKVNCYYKSIYRGIKKKPQLQNESKIMMELVRGFLKHEGHLGTLKILDSMSTHKSESPNKDNQRQGLQINTEITVQEVSQASQNQQQQQPQQAQNDDWWDGAPPPAASQQQNGNQQANNRNSGGVHFLDLQSGLSDIQKERLSSSIQQRGLLSSEQRDRMDSSITGTVDLLDCSDSAAARSRSISQVEIVKEISFGMTNKPINQQQISEFQLGTNQMNQKIDVNPFKVLKNDDYPQDIALRKKLRKFIITEQIEQAILLMEQSFAQLYRSNASIKVSLLSIQFVRELKSKNLQRALQLIQNTELSNDNTCIISCQANGKPIKISPSSLSALFCFTDFNDLNLAKQYPVLSNNHKQAIFEFINKEIITVLQIQAEREQELVTRHVLRKRDSKLERIIKHTTMCLNHISQSPAQLEVASRLKSRPRLTPRKEIDGETCNTKRIRTAVISKNVMQTQIMDQHNGLRLRHYNNVDVYTSYQNVDNKN